MFIYALISKARRHIHLRKKQSYVKTLVRKGLTLGNNVMFVDDVFLDPSHCFLISIGDNCTICPGVRFIAHDASTKRHLGCTKIGKIVIQENCFIGDSATVLPGVTIGRNTIVGAGSVVTKDVAPDSVVAGNPAGLLSTTDQYLIRMEKLKSQRTVFGEEYRIDSIDEAKRREMNDALNDGVGFIV